MKKTFFFLSLIPITLTILIFPYIQDDLILLVRILIYGLIGLSFAVAIAFLFLLREKFLTIQAQRKKAQLESSLVISNGETWVQEHIFKTNEYGKKELTIEYARLGGIRHRVNSHDHNPTPSEILYAHTMLSAGQSKQLLPGPYQENAAVENVPELMTILEKAERVLVKGPSDSGKTTLFVNIASRLDNVIVIDPHYAPGIWPEHCKIVGKGRNHQEITLFLSWLSEELNKRYELRANGKEDYPTLSIIIDEWMSISSRCENATEVITELITEARKAKIRIFIGSHSDQVEALGIKGQGKLREGLIIVRLYFDQITRERSATYDYGRGERACLVPGSTPVVSKGNSFELPELREPDLVVQLSKEESKVSDMLANGDSRSAIARELFGSAGGNQLAKVDKIIAKINS